MSHVADLSESWRRLKKKTAYKPNLGDTRETPAFVIWKLLNEMKADV